jgi:putative FmdB family regulatory protein
MSPLFAFKCEECAHEFEALEKFSEDTDSRTCPHCYQNKAKRVMAPANFMLYGAGVYKPSKR